MTSYQFHLLKQKIDKIASKEIREENLGGLLEETIRLSCGSIEDKEDVIQSIARLIYIKDLYIKKLVYQYIHLLIAYDPDNFLQISNHVRNDLSDPNPAVRIIAYRLIFVVLTNQTHEDFNIIFKALDDDHPNIKIFTLKQIPHLHLPEEFKVEAGSKVMKLMKDDSDSSVVTECISCLIALESFKDYSLILTLFHQIFNMELKSRFALVNAAIKIVDIEKINHEETFQLLNVLENCIESSSHVYFTMSCLKLMLLISSKFEKVHRDVKIRTLKQLLILLNFANGESKIFLYTNICLLIQEKDLVELACLSWTQFSILPNDSPLCCARKMDILKILCTSENAGIILSQTMTVILTKPTPNVLHSAFRLINTLYQYIPVNVSCKVLSLLHHNNPVILNEAIIFVHYLMTILSNKLNEYEFGEQFISLHSHISTTQAKISYLILLTSYIQDDATALKFLPQCHALINNWDVFKKTNSSILSVLLFLITNLFLQFPHLLHKVFKLVIEKSVNHPSPFIANKARFYYQLLKLGIDKSKIVLNTKQTKLVQFPSFNTLYCGKDKHCDLLQNFNTAKAEL